MMINKINKLIKIISKEIVLYKNIIKLVSRDKVLMNFNKLILYKKTIIKINNS